MVGDLVRVRLRAWGPVRNDNVVGIRCGVSWLTALEVKIPRRWRSRIPLLAKDARSGAPCASAPLAKCIGPSLGVPRLRRGTPLPQDDSAANPAPKVT